MGVLDVVTLDEAETELGIDPDTRVLLSGYITSVSRLLDQACGPIVKRTITDEKHNGGSSYLLLDHYPVASVTTVTEYSGLTGTLLTEETVSTAPNGFLLDGSALIRRAGKNDSAWAYGRGNVLVTYVAGRYDDTLSVDERFKRAAIVTLANLWRREQGMGTVMFGADGAPMLGATYALPNAAKAFIQDDLRPSGWAS